MVVARHLDMLVLDDSTMAGIGVSTKMWRLIAVALAVLLGAAGVAAAGVLGFAGLIVPMLLAWLLARTCAGKYPWRP